VYIKFAYINGVRGFSRTGGGSTDISKNIKAENKTVGNLGENIACRYLEKYGYKILCRNFSCSQGEIDIIFKDKNEYVFCEVKTRSNEEYGFPAEAVNFYKQKHIWNTAKYFLYKNNILDECVRFDVIEIYMNFSKPIVNHIKNAFEKKTKKFI
jgi:putative endonuclease